MRHVAAVLLLAGCAAPPPPWPTPGRVVFDGAPLVDPQIPPAPYGGGGPNVPWSPPNSLPAGF